MKQAESVADAAETMGTKRRRRPGRPTLTNEELLDAALDLFMERGFERTSIDAITAAAGMAKRTVYSRYGDKTSLFKAALTRAIEEWIVPIEQLRRAETDDLEETLVRLGRILLSNVLSPAGLQLMRLTNAESVRMPEISTLSVRRGTEPTLTYLTELFDQRLPAAGVRLGDADAAARAFLNIVVGGLASNAAWGMEVGADEIDRHVRYSVHLFLHGLFDRPAVAAAARGERFERLLDEASVQLERARTRLDEARKLAGE